MKKAQVITLSVCALGGISLLAATWILLRGVMRFNETASALNASRQQLSEYYREPIFPSSENVQREESNTSQMKLWFSDLTAALRKGNVASDERSPSRFVGILDRTRERLMRDAQAAGTELPPSFAFGFDLYTGTGALPRPDDVPRLTEQLVLVNRVCKILFDNRVKELRVVERGLFEEGAAAIAISPAVATHAATAGSGRPSASGRNVPAHTGSGVAAMQPGIIPEEGLFGKYRFSFEFNAKETALIAVLNALASSPAFTVVNVVRIAKDVPVLMPAAPEPAAETIAAEQTTIHLGPNYPVCGLEMEVPMRVRIELDVFKFKGESDESGG